jgi:hypothetical protein
LRPVRNQFIRDCPNAPLHLQANVAAALERMIDRVDGNVGAFGYAFQSYIWSSETFLQTSVKMPGFAGLIRSIKGRRRPRCPLSFDIIPVIA